MAKSRLVLAVAGSGKTYYLAEQLNKNNRNIYITFTNKNVENIIKEIKKIHGEIPNNTVVMTYASFVYNWLIKPINPLLEIGSHTGKLIKGIDLHTIPEKAHVNGQYNPRYRKQNHYRHYLNQNNELYISRMVILFNKQSKRVRQLAYKRLERYCDVLFVDEVQDFRSQDYDLLYEIFKLEFPKTLSVGDYYQHSVSYTNQPLRKPFRKGQQYISYNDYVIKEQTTSTVDATTLNRSRRAPEAICKLIREKLDIEIYSKSKMEGRVILVKSIEELEIVLKDRTIPKIVHSGSDKYSFTPTINWSYSKGDTYNNSCVILTDPFMNLFESDFSVEGISQQEINKLYVALTRSKNIVYIVKRKLFSKVSDKYKKNVAYK